MRRAVTRCPARHGGSERAVEVIAKIAQACDCLRTLLEGHFEEIVHPDPEEGSDMHRRSVTNTSSGRESARDGPDLVGTRVALACDYGKGLGL